MKPDPNQHKDKRRHNIAVKKKQKAAKAAAATRVVSGEASGSRVQNRAKVAPPASDGADAAEEYIGTTHAVPRYKKSKARSWNELLEEASRNKGAHFKLRDEKEWDDVVDEGSKGNQLGNIQLDAMGDLFNSLTFKERVSMFVPERYFNEIENGHQVQNRFEDDRPPPWERAARWEEEYERLENEVPVKSTAFEFVEKVFDKMFEEAPRRRKGQHNVVDEFEKPLQELFSNVKLLAFRSREEAYGDGLTEIETKSPTPERPPSVDTGLAVPAEDSASTAAEDRAGKKLEDDRVEEENLEDWLDTVLDDWD